MSKGNGEIDLHLLKNKELSSARMRDMTTGRPLRQILTFAAPLFIGNLFQQIYATTDTTEIAQPRGELRHAPEMEGHR